MSASAACAWSAMEVRQASRPIPIPVALDPSAVWTHAVSRRSGRRAWKASFIHEGIARRAPIAHDILSLAREARSLHDQFSAEQPTAVLVNGAGRPPSTHNHPRRPAPCRCTPSTVAATVGPCWAARPAFGHHASTGGSGFWGSGGSVPNGTNRMDQGGSAWGCAPHQMNERAQAPEARNILPQLRRAISGLVTFISFCRRPPAKRLSSSPLVENPASVTRSGPPNCRSRRRPPMRAGPAAAASPECALPNPNRTHAAGLAAASFAPRSRTVLPRSGFQGLR